MRKAFLLLLLALVSVSLKAQITDVFAGNDTIELRVGNYQYGFVQWQTALDTANWTDIEGAIDTVYRFLPTRNGYYRARATFPNCPEEYSAVCYVQVPPVADAGPDRNLTEGFGATMFARLDDGCVGEWEILEGEHGVLSDLHSKNAYFEGTEGEYKLKWTVTNACGSASDTLTIKYYPTVMNENYLVVDTTDFILSDSTQLLNGEYIIAFSEPVTLNDSMLLMGMRDDSFLRRVVSYTYDEVNNVYDIMTEQGTIADLLMDGVFSFDLSSAFTSKKVVVTDQYPTRKEIAERGWDRIYIIQRDSDEDCLRWNFDIGQPQLSWTPGNFKLPYDFEIIPLFSMEKPNFMFEFEKHGFHVDSFKFGLYNTTYNLSAQIFVPGKVSFSVKEKLPILPKPIKFPSFVLFGVKLTPELSCDLNLSLQYSLGPEMYFYLGQTGYVSSYIIFDDETGWDGDSGIRRHYNFDADWPDYGDLTGKASIDLKLSILGYDILGPYAGFSLAFEGTHNTFGSGFTAEQYKLKEEYKLGAKMKVFGWNIFDVDWPFVTFDMLNFQNPYSIQYVSGNNQPYTPGQQLSTPLRVRVKKSNDKPSKGVMVKYETGGSSRTVLTDDQGFASVHWTPGANATGEIECRASSFNVKNEPVQGAPVLFKAHPTGSGPGGGGGGGWGGGTDCSTLSVTAYINSNNGLLYPRASGGHSPYMFSKDGVSYGGSVYYNPIQGQTYHFYVKDKEGCVSECYYTHPTQDCSTSDLSLRLSHQGSTVTAHANGGRSPYQFALDEGSYGNAYVFYNLANGEHVVNVRDADGCVDVASITLDAYGGGSGGGTGGGGTNSGSVTVTTSSSVYVVDATSAHGGGSVSITGNATVSSYGLCWSRHHGPTTSDDYVQHAYNGSTFSGYLMTNLESNKMYYVRAFAVTNKGTVYGNEVGFSTTAVPPVVTCSGVGNITASTARALGNVSNVNGTTVTERGFCWSTGHNPTIYDDHIACGYGTGAYMGNLTNLTPETVYYLRAYAINSEGTGYSEEVRFETFEAGGGGSVPEGAINGLFSVGGGQQVYFSQGNLQYCKSSNTWSFMENQYDVVGYSWQSVGDDYAYQDVISLFGWGTSGYNHGATCYQPWSTSENDGSYYAYGNPSSNLFDQTGKADWGYNAISNGGGVENDGWRTLTAQEWNYILNNRMTESGLRFALASVMGVGGMMLFPDDWDLSVYSPNNMNENGSFSSNVVSDGQWRDLEQLGVVFLPVAGFREGGSVQCFDGRYWSSSRMGGNGYISVSYYLAFTDGSVDPFSNYSISSGLSVRLVHAPIVPPSTGSLPMVKTLGATNVTPSSMNCEGRVVLSGSATVIDRGICWGTSHQPSIHGNHVSAGGGTGSYTLTVTGLQSAATYYYRAYATSAVGTSYGAEERITMPYVVPDEVPEGAVNGLFSVGNGSQVFFAKGNLQYCALSDTWRFAENQYDYVGDGNNNASPTYGGWIDLYGWGTSGFDHGAVCFQPWGSSNSPADYYAYGNETLHLYDQTGQADWGYNAVINGGNQTGVWKTLKKEEWYYLLQCRHTPSGMRFAKASVNGINGVVILPDGWNADDYPLNNVNEPNAYYDVNTISAAQWQGIETHGAVFIPATSIYGEGFGFYWASSMGNSTNACDVRIYDHALYILGDKNRSHKSFVRLVRPFVTGASVGNLSQVITFEGEEVSCTTATCGGNVVSDGGSPVTERGVCWSTSHNPSLGDNRVSAGTGLGSFTARISNLLPSTTYYVRAYATNAAGTAYGNEISFTTLHEGCDDHEYVDLGLPSGTLWAVCNVGANTPEEVGDYFAWGETQPKELYWWSDYLYCNGTNQLTKYCNNPEYGYNGFTDDLTVLQAEDDAAKVNWGDEWKTPSYREWEELCGNTTRTWVTQNDVGGLLFTASNGNTLFLPATGYKDEGWLWDAGRGYYWTSLLSSDDLNYSDDPTAVWQFMFDSGWNSMMNGGWNRVNGAPVRAVRPNPLPIAEVPEGGINGLFSVDEYHKVYFSKGNLQYQATTDTWRFAEHQWDYAGYDNDNISPTYDGWIDLFGWGTSGYDHGAVCYQPWSTSEDFNDYAAYGNPDYGLFDQNGQADWGYNAISNGENTTNLWRTMTDAEWRYILDNRVTPSGIRYAKAIVNGVCGLILLPDDWDPSVFSLSDINGGNFSSNYVSGEEWFGFFESNGAVFLPAAGDRYGHSVVHEGICSVGSSGYYWMSNPGWDGEVALSVCIQDHIVYPNGNNGCMGERYVGHAVRLVFDATHRIGRF